MTLSKEELVKRLGAEAARVSELDWFRLQLQLLAIESKAPKRSVRYEIDEDASASLIGCGIYHDTAQVFMEDGTSKEEQLSYYRDWVEGEADRIEKITVTLRTLGERFRVREHITFTIYAPYGMGSTRVCTIKGSTVEWFV
jgi:hypothetical protein